MATEDAMLSLQPSSQPTVPGWAEIDDDGIAFLSNALGPTAPIPSDSAPLDHNNLSPSPASPNLPLADGAPVTPAGLTELLDIAIQSGASDLHLSADLAPHVRINGELRPIRGVGPLDHQAIDHLLLEQLTPSQRQTLTDCGDLDLAMEWRGSQGRNQRFRVSIFRQSGSFAGAFRVVSKGIPTIQDLGLPDIVRAFADLNHGLVLVTGRTGSGKSTTLAAMIEHINRTRSTHIITIEDPIEYRHVTDQSIIQQREVGVDTSSFSSALRHALRQDPDVILIGELRDLDTMRTALTAAETGHLVLATLHSSDTTGAVTRMIDVFPGDQQPQIRSQLALSLQGIITQDLVPTTAGTLLPATEILRATSAARNLIREDKLHQLRSLLETGSEDGMHSFEQSLADMVRRGLVAREAAMTTARDQATLASLVAS